MENSEGGYKVLIMKRYMGKLPRFKLKRGLCNYFILKGGAMQFVPKKKSWITHVILFSDKIPTHAINNTWNYWILLHY